MKWSKASEQFSTNVIAEELRAKVKQNAALKKELNGIYVEIRRNCSSLQYMCILRTMVNLRKKHYEKMMSGHINKIMKLLNKDHDVEKHIQNISSYKLSFFQKLVLCRGLKFSLPQRISSMDIQASFEKAFWQLEPSLSDDKKELAAATLRSIALNYIECKAPKPPKALQRAIEQLKRRDDIVITKPDKGTGVVVMDKAEYVRLLSESSINDTAKFTAVSSERPKTRGRPPKNYHPLLQKEKHLESVVRKILPKQIADSVCPKGSRLAHLYGLPKTHKEKLAMRPILSATSTYNFALARWLDDKLKPLPINSYTISDTFSFADEIRNLSLNESDILVSYDVSSLFTNVPLQETIEILADRAFVDDWFNKTHHLNISKADLIELLSVATKDQLFQFNGQLYQQIDGVAMGSPLGPLMANTFLCSIEEKLQNENKLPDFYRRYVDDTLATMKDIPTAEAFLNTLNNCHPSISFTMEIASNGKLPFVGIEICKKGCKLVTSVYRKPTNTGLLLHHQSHVDNRYKRSLVKTMLNRAYRLSSTWELFSTECERLKLIFSNLKYSDSLVNSTITRFVNSVMSPDTRSTPPTENIYRIVLPFKDQKSADIVKKHLSDLSNKLDHKLQPVFRSRKIGDDLKVQEPKPPLINQQCVVYNYICDLCDAEYVGSLAVIFTSALRNTDLPPSENTLKMNTELIQLVT